MPTCALSPQRASSPSTKVFTDDPTSFPAAGRHPPGGGGDDDAARSAGTDARRLSLTDAPACRYDSAFVTVEKTRVHQRSDAGDNDAGWSAVALPSPQHVDLLTLNTGRVNAVMTGMPVVTDTSTVIGSGATSPVASGRVTVGGQSLDTGAGVRATQTFGGATVETGYSAADAVTRLYGLRLPAGAPAWLPHAAAATSVVFRRDNTAVARYRLDTSAPGLQDQPVDITLNTDLTTDFAF